MTDLRITGFYPPHYVNSKDEQINAVIDVSSAYFTLFENDIESFLQKLTLTEGVDPIYAQELCDFLQITYVDVVCFQFMKAKKTPTNAITLKQVFLEVFPFLEGIITITENENHKAIHIEIDTHQDKIIYQLMRDFLPFFYTYIPLIIPVGLRLKINLKYVLTIQDFMGKSINTLLGHTMKEIQEWEEVP